jgi:hypothetical protein
MQIGRGDSVISCNQEVPHGVATDRLAGTKPRG